MNRRDRRRRRQSEKQTIPLITLIKLICSDPEGLISSLEIAEVYDKLERLGPGPRMIADQQKPELTTEPGRIERRRCLSVVSLCLICVYPRVSAAKRLVWFLIAFPDIPDNAAEASSQEIQSLPP